MTDTKRLTQETSSDDHRYEEEWKVVMNTGGKYILSKAQAGLLMESMRAGKREIMFKTFMIAIPYVAEFYRTRRFLKDTYKLPERATEEEFKPTPEQKKRIEKIKKEMRENLLIKKPERIKGS